MLQPEHIPVKPNVAPAGNHNGNICTGYKMLALLFELLAKYDKVLLLMTICGYPLFGPPATAWIFQTLFAGTVQHWAQLCWLLSNNTTLLN